MHWPIFSGFGGSLVGWLVQRPPKDKFGGSNGQRNIQIWNSRDPNMESAGPLPRERPRQLHVTCSCFIPSRQYPKQPQNIACTLTSMVRPRGSTTNCTTRQGQETIRDLTVSHSLYKRSTLGIRFDHLVDSDDEKPDPQAMPQGLRAARNHVSSHFLALSCFKGFHLYANANAKHAPRILS